MADRAWTVGSLFSGIGGLDLGFERAGFVVRWQVEIDPFCRAVLRKHWPHVRQYADVRDFRLNGWRALESVDVLVAGFPCQDVSDAGLRRGLSGDRSWLWWHVRRATRLLRPAVLVVENVRGLLSRGLGTVLGSLSRIGYDAEWAVVRASDAGAPQLRARVFVLAHADGRRWQGERGEKHDAFESARGRKFDGCVAERWRWPAGRGEAPYEWEPARTVLIRRWLPLFDGAACGQSSLGFVSDGLSPGLVRHRRRVLTALGNAVVPQVAELVAGRVRQLLEHETVEA